MNWIAIDPLTLKYATRIESPTADSAAATRRTKKAKERPQKESRERETKIKIRFTARRRTSIDIRRVRIFFLLTTIPKIPIRNKKKKKSINSVGSVA